MSERMTADEARALLAGMTPGTLSVERVAGIRRLAVPQGDELALVIRDSPREFGGAMYSLEVCRGMDGPTREGNAAAFAAVKRALATVAEVSAERDGWIETARGYSNGLEYYRGIVDRVAGHLGPAVYVCDDGGISDEPLRAKVAELVDAWAAASPAPGAAR